ncbi:MAG: ankyrin repeat protein [Cocleimonas sp.]|jgi:ankyrin repeat protein
MASARGHFEAVMVLVRNGANVNARTVKKWIPPHHAVRFRQANIVNFLVQLGASANVRTSDGLSSIDMANNNRDYRILSILGAR